MTDPQPGAPVAGARGVLDGLRVVSMAEQYPGPYATLILADLGADVVLVERPQGGDPSRAFPAFHEALNRNKRSVALDLKRPADRERFLDLVQGADVMLEGFRPGTVERLGIDHATVSARNPRIVYVSVTGFGQDGPYRMRPGHDVAYQALAGMLFEHADGRAGGNAPAIAVGDLSAGLFAALGAVLGLLSRERTGEGTYVDVSMLDGLVSLMTALVVPVLNRSGEPGFPHEPGYRLYVASDGGVLALGVAHEDHFWRALCETLGLPDLAGLPSDERLARKEELTERLQDRFATAPRDEWLARLHGADVPCGAAYSLDEVPGDAQVRARGLVVDVPATAASPARRHITQPLRLSGFASRITRHSPALGEHTEEILAETGDTDA